MRFITRFGLAASLACLASARQLASAEDYTVSLQVTNVPAQAAYEQLFRALSIKVSEGDNPIWSKVADKPVTLDAQKQPFWDVMIELDRLTGVTLSAVRGGEAVLFMDNGKLSRMPGVTSGPLRISAGAADTQQAIILSKVQSKSETSTVSIQVQADPRIHAATLELAPPTKQAGRGAQPGGPDQQQLSNTIRFSNGRAIFRTPVQRADPSQTTVDLHLQFTYWCVMESVALEMNLGGNPRITKNFGKFTADAVYHSTARGGSVVDLTMTNTGMEPLEWRCISGALDAAEPSLADAAGHLYRRNGGGGNGAGARIMRTVHFTADPKDTSLGEPTSFVWNIPTRLQSQAVDVALKKILLP